MSPFPKNVSNAGPVKKPAPWGPLVSSTDNCMHSRWIIEGKPTEKWVHLRAPAKINFYLRVQRRLLSGYHEIQSLMIPISLADTVRITSQTTTRAPRFSLTCTDPTLPTGSENLAMRSLRILTEAGILFENIHIHLEKNIPVGAGLGGGSSDAAAVLKGIDYLCGETLSSETLRHLALKIGADVPFFILERPCLVSGIGDYLEPVGLTADIFLILAYPGFPVSTAKAYQALDSELTKPTAQVKMPFSPGGEKQWGKGEWQLVNDLEIPVFSWYPSLKDMCGKLKGLGALEARMTGSGSSVFGIFPEEQAAKTAIARLRVQAPKWRFFLARPLWQGFEE